MREAVITDHSFETSDVEKSILEPAGRTLRTSVANTVAAAIRGEKLPNVVNGVSA